VRWWSALLRTGPTEHGWWSSDESYLPSSMGSTNTRSSDRRTRRSRRVPRSAELCGGLVSAGTGRPILCPNSCQTSPRSGPRFHARTCAQAGPRFRDSSHPDPVPDSIHSVWLVLIAPRLGAVRPRGTSRRHGHLAVSRPPCSVTATLHRHGDATEHHAAPRGASDRWLAPIARQTRGAGRGELAQ
jgi:hypothetical protein